MTSTRDHFPRTAHELAPISSGLVAPSLFMYEFLNSIRNGRRVGQLTVEQGSIAVTALFDLCVRLEPVPDVIVAMRISKCADAHGLTAYDASYIELALRTMSPLAAFDDALTDAARAECVEVIGVSAN
jgi:predicted nucleic acid-binding protein